MTGWYHRLDGHEFEQAPGDGDRQGRLQSIASQRVRHDWATELTQLTYKCLGLNSHIFSPPSLDSIMLVTISKYFMIHKDMHIYLFLQDLNRKKNRWWSLSLSSTSLRILLFWWKCSWHFQRALNIFSQRDVSIPCAVSVLEIWVKYELGDWSEYLSRMVNLSLSEV